MSSVTRAARDTLQTAYGTDLCSCCQHLRAADVDFGEGLRHARQVLGTALESPYLRRARLPACRAIPWFDGAVTRLVTELADPVRRVVPYQVPTISLHNAGDRDVLRQFGERTS